MSVIEKPPRKGIILYSLQGMGDVYYIRHDEDKKEY